MKPWLENHAPSKVTGAVQRPAWLVACALLAIGGWALWRAHRLYMHPAAWLNVDEGYAAALAGRLLDTGGLPYVEGISVRGPLMYWIYELALRIGGPYSIAAVRTGAILSSLATVLALWFIPVALGSPLAGGISVLVAVWSLTVAWPHMDGLAWNGELVGLPFLLGSIALVLWASRGERPSRMALALWITSGALAACAFFVKQAFGPNAVWTAVWVLVAVREPLGARVRRVAAFATGAAAIAVAVLLPYGVSRHLDDFWYYFVRYGREIYMAPVSLQDLVQVFKTGVLTRSPFYLFALASALLLAGRIVWCLRTRGDRRAAVYWLLISGHLLVAIPCAVFTGRYFGHYFLQVDAFMSIVLALTLFGIPVGGSGIEGPRRWRRYRGAAAAAATGIVLLPFLHAGQDRQYKETVNTNWFQSMLPSKDPIAAWIRANTKPDDSIFVWGLRGEIYVNAQRKPASRYVYCLFPSGVVPWYKESLRVQETRVVPGSQEKLLADLESSRAEIIVDAGNSLMDRSMGDYPILRTYLMEKYHVETVIRLREGRARAVAVPVYRRAAAAAAALSQD